MTSRDGQLAGLGALVALLVGGACAPVTDTVFTPLALEPGPPIVVAEGAGIVELSLRLSEPAGERVATRYRLIGLEAQNDCQTPDFEAAEGRIEWAAGSSAAAVRVWIGDDDLAETDERLALELEPLEGLPGTATSRLELVIADDDRTDLIDARERGLVAGLADDQAVLLQALLDEAASSGRGVVVVPAGDYVISSLRLAPGTTLSGAGARFARPALSVVDVVSLGLEHSGAEHSEPALIEGLTIDGQRDAQGPYREREREEAHLIELTGDAQQPGRVRAHFERLTLLSGTASGLMIRSNAEATVCALHASELWRDGITASGGASVVRLRDVDLTATEGTGLWLGARASGYADSYALTAEVENLRVGAGDVEIEATTGSSIDIRRLTMTESPFRLDAPDGVVRIADSVLVIGVPSSEHDYWGRPHDVEITGTTLLASESSAEPLAEASRTLAAVSIGAQTIASGNVPASIGRLVFDTCRFERAGDVEADDVVYAAAQQGAVVSVLIRSSVLGTGLSDWFAPGCDSCTLEP